VQLRKNHGGLADFHYRENPAGQGSRDKICKSKGRHGYFAPKGPLAGF